MPEFEKSTSLRRKLFIAFLLTILLPLVIISLTIGLNLRSAAKDDFGHESRDTMKLSDQTMQALFDEVKHNSAMLADNANVRQSENNLTVYLTAAQAAAPPTAQANTIQSLLAMVQKAHENYNSIKIGTRDGGFIEAPSRKRDVGYTPLDRPWYTAALAKPDEVIITEPYVTKKGEPVTSVAKAIHGPGGAVIGALAIDVYLKRLSELVAGIKFGESGYLIVIAPDGTVLANPKHPESIMKKINEEGGATYEGIDTLKSGEQTELNVDGQTMLASAFDSPNLGWRYIALLSKSEALHSHNRLVAIITAIGLLIGAIFVGISLLMANSIAKPLQLASTTLKEIAQGGGDLSKRFKVESTDEVGEVAHWFNQFIETLENLARDLKQIALQVTMASEEVAAGSQGLSQSTQQQASSIEEVAATIEQVTGSIRQTADNAAQGSAKADEMVTLASETGNLANELVGAMNEINASSMRIGDIIDTVNEVAFQTNLLALNAAVEAARAGEHGKGFAVVASEVRALAQRSAESASEVRNLIEDSLSKVKNGDSIVRRSDQAMSAITSHINTIATTMREIASASREQATGIEELNRAISMIDNSTQQNAGTVEELASTADSLSNDSRSLSQLVAGFKVSGELISPVENRMANTRREQKTATIRHEPKPKPAAPVPPATPAKSNRSNESFEDDFEEF